MGMSIQSTSGAASSQTVSSTSTWQQRKQDFQNLSQALQSGNLDQAKSAYAQLVKDSPASATKDPNGPLAQIGKSLQSGDIAGAQKTMSGMKSHHGGRHHSSTTTSASTTTPASNPTASLGNTVDTLA
jgi:outer membrane protein assembly factor BamD (BamD/ComL family)